MNQALRYALIAGGAIISILLFLLASASDNSGFFGHYYSWLLGVNVAAAVGMLLLVIVALWRLYSRYKAGKFGSRLMARLMLMFAAIGTLPGLVIFAVSVQFVSHSIDSWFNVKIEAAIESGLSLGHAALDQALSELGSSAEISAATLAGQDARDAQSILMRIVSEQDGVQSAVLVGPDGKMIAGATTGRREDLKADLPTAPMLLQAVMPGGYSRPEGGLDRDLKDMAGAAGSAPNALDAVTGLRLRVVHAIP